MGFFRKRRWSAVTRDTGDQTLPPQTLPPLRPQTLQPLRPQTLQPQAVSPRLLPPPQGHSPLLPPAAPASRALSPPSRALSPVSDTATLTGTRAMRHQLQETYVENYSGYLPFLLAQMRLGARESDAESDTTVAPDTLMARAPDAYSCKRTMVVAQTLLRGTAVFGSDHDWDCFRAGRGAPLWRVHVPYMLALRRRVPFMVFDAPEPPARPPEPPARPPEPARPAAPAAPAPPAAPAAPAPPFCTVHVRCAQHYRRFVLRFAGGDMVVVFQHNFFPFADFAFRGTRFRVVGTALAPYLVAPYTAQLRLLVVDAAQAALCDRVVAREHQHRPWRAPDPARPMPDDPVPHPTNALLIEAAALRPSTSVPARHMPRDRPPFGLCMDACVYRPRRVRLRKHVDVARVVVYQAGGPAASSAAATSDAAGPADPGAHELMVLAAVLLALRENSLRTAVRHPNALGPGPGLLFSL